MNLQLLKVFVDDIMVRLRAHAAIAGVHHTRYTDAEVEDVIAVTDPKAHKTSHEFGGSDIISLEDLSGNPADTINNSLLTAQGDIITRNGSNPKRLPLGTEGHFLKAGASEPEWAAVAGVVGEGHITILPFSYDSIGQGTWVLTITTWEFLNGHFVNSSGGNGDNISYKVYLDAGTYTLVLLGDRFTNHGILDFDIDTTEVASFDQYYATPNYNILYSQTGIVVSSAGLKTLKARVDGKNASSSAYYCGICFIALWRTA